MPSIVLMLITLPVLLAASAFFSGSETALFSLSRHQRAILGRERTVVAATVTTLLTETRGLLITLLLGNMTINVLYFAIASMIAIRAGGIEGAGPLLPTLATILTLVGIVLLGEVLPKLVAARMPLAWSRMAALPLWLFHRSIAPVRVASSRLIIAPLARLIAPPVPPPALSAEELESLLALSEDHGVIDADEEHLLQHVLELSQIKVRDLMVPRVDIRAHDIDDDPRRLIDLIRQTRLRHLPVYRNDLDDIAGFISSRRALLNPPRSRADVEHLLVEARFVPQQQRGDRLLVELRRTGASIAIVVDEYGGTAGLVAIEDVVEHMVGDIAGAYEADGVPRVQALSDGRYRADADLSVHDWPDVFGRNPAVRGVAELEAISTVGGLVMAQLGRVPAAGDRVRVGNVDITVDTMVGSRVSSVVIELHREQEQA